MNQYFSHTLRSFKNFVRGRQSFDPNDITGFRNYSKKLDVSIMRKCQNQALMQIATSYDLTNVLNVGSVPEEGDKEGSFYKNYFDSSVNYYTIDKNRSSSQPNHLQFDLHELPDLDIKFDLVMCMSVLEHTENPFLVVKQIYNILGNESYLYLANPWFYPLHKDIHGRYGDYWRFSDDAMRLLCTDFQEIWVRTMPSAVTSVCDRPMYWDNPLTTPTGYMGLFKKSL